MSIKYPTVLAFERKINPSDGFLYATKWDDRDDKEKSIPLKLVEKSVRGTTSNKLKSTKEKDTIQLSSKNQDANLKKVDYCALPQECDTLKMIFTVKIIGGVGTPSSCNAKEFQNKLNSAVCKYNNKYGFKELGKRYAYNIASGRSLWRNRVGAAAIEVRVKALGTDKTWLFDGKNYSIRNFDNYDEKVLSFGEFIAETLSGSECQTLEVITFAKIENGQEVFPSQELVLDKEKSSNDNKSHAKSKILYAVDGIAALHSQKIGNALRTIDTWYPDYSDPINSVGPIAAEPYGAVTNIGKAFRSPSDKVDFFTLFEQFICETSLNQENDMHYVMSVLIRGGVFS